MKLKFIFVLAIALALAAPAMALAVPYAWDVRQDFGHYLAKGDSFDFAFDLTGLGFAPGQDWIKGYALSVTLADDQARDPAEKGWVDQVGRLGDGFAYLGENVYQASLFGLGALNLWGELPVSIIGRKGDFIFESSRLVAWGENNSGTAPVPEPATLLLFGSGLFAVCGLRRKKNRK